VRAQVAADVDDRYPGGGDALPAREDEVGIAVAVGIDALDVDDPPARRLAAGEPLRAARRLDLRRGLAIDRLDRRRRAWAVGIVVPAPRDEAGRGGDRG
jgi:hypothetical protein